MGFGSLPLFMRADLVSEGEASAGLCSADAAGMAGQPPTAEDDEGVRHSGGKDRQHLLQPLRSRGFVVGDSG